jgi:hypothetical protein
VTGPNNPKRKASRVSHQAAASRHAPQRRRPLDFPSYPWGLQLSAGTRPGLPPACERTRIPINLWAVHRLIHNLACKARLGRVVAPCNAGRTLAHQVSLVHRSDVSAASRHTPDMSGLRPSLRCLFVDFRRGLLVGGVTSAPLLLLRASSVSAGSRAHLQRRLVVPTHRRGRNQTRCSWREHIPLADKMHPEARKETWPRP